MKIDFKVDSVQLSRMSRMVAELHGQHQRIQIRAMIAATKASKAAVAQKIFPMIQGGPTPWTRRGLIGIYGNQTSAIGFNYGEGSLNDLGFTFGSSGTPSGRYMGINASGGGRPAKSTEKSLRRYGKIYSNRFIVPAEDSDANKFDQYGNIPGPIYKQMLSRLRASEFGSAPKGKGSRGRSGKKKAQTDYFIMQTNRTMYIAKRSGHGPKGNPGGKGRPKGIGYRRGFDVAFFITQQPQYRPWFPIRSVAWREYQRVFPIEYDKQLRKIVK